MYKKKEILNDIDSLKRSLTSIDKQVLETKNNILEDISLSKIEEEKVFEKVRSRLTKLEAKKKNLLDFKSKLEKEAESYSKKINNGLEEKRILENKIKELLKKKKQLPILKREINRLRRENDKVVRKNDSVRVLVDQLNLVIKETLMQQEQLKSIKNRLDKSKTKFL